MQASITSDRKDTPPASGQNFALAFLFARRELRAGLYGFYVFIACIALGVASIVGVSSLARIMGDSIDRQGAAILGGDLAFSLIHRQADEDELAFLHELGDVSRIATLRTMARIPGQPDLQTLIELKAVDEFYPLRGNLALKSNRAIQPILSADSGQWNAAVDATLLERLNVKIGDHISIGNLEFTIAAIVESEPDLLASGPSLGPRVMISDAALQQSGLVQPGSLVSWHYRVTIPPGSTPDAVTAAVERANQEFDRSGWRIRTRNNSAPGLRRGIDRFAQFLALIGLTALVVGGVGVANAVRAHLDSKRSVIATFKCVGARANFVFLVYLLQILMLASVGIGLGLIIGALLPVVASAALGPVIPFALEAQIYPLELLHGIFYGYLTALAFALWSLGRVHDISPRDLFRADYSRFGALPRMRYIAATLVSVAALAALAYLLSYDKYIALIYIAATAAAFGLLMGVSRLVMVGAKSVKGIKSSILRLAIANIYRPGALTPSVVLSLGLGLTLLVTLALIDGNLRRELTMAADTKAPSFFFFDIQNSELSQFTKAASNADTKVETAPLLRGRITELKGIEAKKLDPPPSSAWVLRGDRGLTYSATLPKNSYLTAGDWWPADYDGPPLVSVEDEVAQDFDLNIGDEIMVNTLGRDIRARIANFRSVEWESFAINFVLVFSPNSFAGAPHGHLATISLTGDERENAEKKLFSQLLEEFPTITGVRIREAIERVNEIIAQLALAIRTAASVTLIASILVLGGAIAAGHQNRVNDAVIMKMLGATRRRITGAFLLEYSLLGLITGIFAIIAGGLAASFVVTQIMGGTFTFLPLTAITAAFISLILNVLLGLAGSWRILGEKPAKVLRNL